MISINGQNGNYQTKSKWDNTDFSSTSSVITLDVWAYLKIDEQEFAIPYSLNQTTLTLQKCQGSSNVLNVPNKSDFEGVLEQLANNPSKLSLIRKLKRTDGKKIKFFIDNQEISGVSGVKNVFRNRSEENPSLKFNTEIDWKDNQPSKIIFRTK